MKTFFGAMLAVVLSAPAAAQLAVPNDNGITFGHIHLNVSDPDEHARLWTKYFDGEVVQRGNLRMVKFPGFLLALRAQEPTGGTQGSVMNHFGFKIRDLQKFLDTWRAAGYSVDREFTGSEGQPNAYVTMPDGVWVELQEDQMLPVEVWGYHIHYRTPEYESLLDWYVDVFDLEIRPRGSIPKTTNVPGMNMSFATSDEPVVGTKGRSLDHIGFEVDNLEVFVKRLKERGVRFDVDYRVNEQLGIALAFLTDPSGVYIELTEGLDTF